MRQGRIHHLARLLLLTALVLGASGGGPASARTVATPAKSSRDTKSGDDASTRRAANTLRQFTGYVSAIDKTSITVEKRGRKPETRVFTKLDDMRTTGDVGKDARVTVYYREQDGKSVAHRVVVKPARASTKKS